MVFTWKGPDPAWDHVCFTRARTKLLVPRDADNFIHDVLIRVLQGRDKTHSVVLHPEVVRFVFSFTDIICVFNVVDIEMSTPDLVHLGLSHNDFIAIGH